MHISLRLSDLDGLLVKKYAEHNNMTVSDFVRTIVFQTIEKDYELLRKKMEESVNEIVKNR